MTIDVGTLEEFAAMVPAVRSGAAVHWSEDGVRVLLGAGAADRRFDAPASFVVFAGASAAAVVRRLPPGARRIETVPAGSTPDLAARLMRDGETDPIVAVGGGRVIDTAKIVGAVTGQEVIAIPTTLSGAEMTRFHASLPDRTTSPTRAARIQWDPETLAALDDQTFFASAANALAHLIESAAQPQARHFRPDSIAAGAECFGRFARAIDAGEPASALRVDAAAAAVCAGYALDGSGLALLHVLSQSLAAASPVPHSIVYAALLPAILPLLRARRPDAIDSLEVAVGVGLDPFARRLADHATGGLSLGAFDLASEHIDAAATLALSRRELGRIAPAPDAEEIRAVYDSAR